MPTYTEVIRFEEETPINTIRLVKSGEFYRAYNHSAWLFQCCITEHKVMRKYIKSLKTDIYYIGFPEKSLFNNIGERKSTKTEYGFDIELLEFEVPNEEAYETWKTTIETEQSSKGDFHSLPLAGEIDGGSVVFYEGSFGTYWSSTYSNDNPYYDQIVDEFDYYIGSYGFTCQNYGFIYNDILEYSSYYGLTIRPVIRK